MGSSSVLHTRSSESAIRFGVAESSGVCAIAADRSVLLRLLISLWLTVFIPSAGLGAQAQIEPAEPAERDVAEALRWTHPNTAATQISQKSATHDKTPVQRFRVFSQGIPEVVQIRALTAPSMLHNDYTASVKLHSSMAGIRLGLIIVLPHQVDPRTKKPLETILPGDTFRDPDRWQTLQVAVTKKSVESQLRRVRADLNRSDIVMSQAMVVGLALLFETSPGESFFDVGASTFGPLISPSKPLIQLVSAETESPEQPEPEGNFIPIDIELGGLMMEGRPVILRMAPDHSEHFQTLRDMRLNAIWIADPGATARARELYLAKFAVLATPPHPEFEPNDYSRLRHSLPPLDRQCPNVSAWYHGTRITPEEQPHLLGIAREVRSADRVFQRLQMADVTGAEGAVAREVDLVGIGRHVVGREATFGELRNFLIRRQHNAGQLSFPWTWIQTEPSTTQQLWRQTLGGRQPYVEPEQIHQGVYAALSAGYKGLGFWKTHALQVDNPADRETAIAIELACMEIELLEPFLARGRMEGYLSLQAAATDKKARGKGTSSAISSAIGGRSVGATVAGNEGPVGHDAAVISGNGNTLILATAWDDVTQFVPGPMFEREVSLVVAASETASACQISTTGYTLLPREVTAGGLSLRIQNFHQSAALVVFSNPGLVIPELKQKIHEMAPRAAAKTTELASLKYVRVLETIELLRDEHKVPPTVDSFMSQAKQQLDRADYELSHKAYHEAALRALDSMFFVRQAQQICWKDAISGLTSPSASPHTISFATLPDHWKLMHYLEQQSYRLSDNLVASGNFETVQSPTADGWSLDIQPRSAYSANAEIIQDSRAGKILRMIAWQSDESTTRVAREDLMPLTVTLPPIEVSTGDIMVITGRVRRGRTASVEAKRSLLVFDSELGPESSLRFELDSDWTTFEMFRPIGNASEFSVTFALAGQAKIEEVHLDDLVVRKLPTLASKDPIQFTGNPTKSEPRIRLMTPKPAQ